MENRKKPQPMFCVSAKLWLHSEMHTVMRHTTTFQSKTDCIYNGGKNFWKLQISRLWRKITCQSKSSVLSGNGFPKELLSIRRPRQCQVSSEGWWVRQNTTAETCSHRQTNKSRSYDRCVLTDPTTLICIKTQWGR